MSERNATSERDPDRNPADRSSADSPLAATEANETRPTSRRRPLGSGRTPATRPLQADRSVAAGPPRRLDAIDPTSADGFSAMQMLKSHTAPLHEAAEIALSPRGRLETREGYAVLLLAFERALVPVMRAVRRHPAFGSVPDAGLRTIRGPLRGDLQILSLQFASIAAHCGQLDDDLASGEAAFPLDPDSEAELLGALYVVEGSSLGGVSLSRMVRGRHERVPTDYFDRYGSQTGPLWRRLGEHVDRRVLTADDRDAAADRASAVFERVIEVGVDLADLRLRDD